MNQANRMIASKVGPLYLVASDKGLQAVFWKHQKPSPAKSSQESKKAEKILNEAARQIGEYLNGKRKKFALRFDLQGTPFQKSVWNELRKIPYGKTNSYKDIARRIKNTKAVRAVGSANGKNPICIIVPCHRVISHNGTIGGYSGGLDKKRKLLNLEKIKLAGV